ncbi:hypothetical protein BTJ39_05105 [Izhakiella australiensis]|uniref:Uncharacterized protein n=2 Tax=Izhakiella australiensis TaxID=1926881 RepID=A0A1S8YRT9_9GAMM|nr:hypothetical protein BTJ39_05105 [Izhakiella australiensis]
MVAVMTLPVMVGAVGAWQTQQQLTAMTDRAQQQLNAHQQAARKIVEKMRRQQKVKAASPDALSLLNPIGKALSAEVSLLQVDASFQQQHVRMEVAAKSLPALLDFSARLQRIPAKVELQNHRPAQDKSGRWPLQATLNLKMDTHTEAKHG